MKEWQREHEAKVQAVFPRMEANAATLVAADWFYIHSPTKTPFRV